MNEEAAMEPAAPPVDLGEYCRRVEDHLTRVNAGHLVRVVGPGFELVRRWAESGVPLSVVYRGIDLKAERHREGASKRPLRIEFCAGDVQAVFDQWRRAVGVLAYDVNGSGAPGEDDAGNDGAQDIPEHARKRPSLRRHLERAIERLSRAAGRFDMPDPLRVECSAIVEALAALKESAAGLRGPARHAAEGELTSLEARLSAAVRVHAPAGSMEAIRAEAAADLAPFRARLAPEAWERSMQVTVDRLLRDRFGLPTLQQ